MYIKGIKNFFPVPNCIFNLGLSGEEIAVYIYLMFCENRNTNKCYPSFRTIGNTLKMSRGTVKKYVDLLCGKDLISTEPTQIITSSGRKQNGNLEYTILPIQVAIDSYNKRQTDILELEREKALLKQRLEQFEASRSY